MHNGPKAGNAIHCRYEIGMADRGLNPKRYLGNPAARIPLGAAGFLGKAKARRAMFKTICFILFIPYRFTFTE